MKFKVNKKYLYQSFFIYFYTIYEINQVINFLEYYYSRQLYREEILKKEILKYLFQNIFIEDIWIEEIDWRRWIEKNHLSIIITRIIINHIVRPIIFEHA